MPLGLAPASASDPAKFATARHRHVGVKSRRFAPFVGVLVPLRSPEPARLSSPDLPEPRASRPSITPMPSHRSSLSPRASVMPGAGLHMHSVLLSGVAGYVDAAGFASLVGLLPAHVTGELVSDAIALSTARVQSHVHLWVLPVFLGAVVTAAVAARLLRRRGERPLAGLLLLMTIALTLFSVSDPIARLLHQGAHLSVWFSGSCAVAAMGLQNALMRESLILSCPTTVMTGNLTQVIVDLVDRALTKLLPPSQYDRKPRSRLGPVSAALAAFIACAVLGGFLTRLVGSLSAVLPTAVAAFLTARAWREDRARVAPSNPIAAAGTPRVPTFEPVQVWPDSLVPPSGPVSVSQVRAAPMIPPIAEWLPPSSPNRPAQEKRTISGTQLAQRFRDEGK